MSKRTDGKSQSTTTKKMKLSENNKPCPSLMPGFFNEMIPNDVLAIILRFISAWSDFQVLALVNQRFHTVIYATEYGCFDEIVLIYPFMATPPNPSVVKRIMLENNLDEDCEEEDEIFAKLDRVEYVKVVEHEYVAFLFENFQNTVRHIYFENYLDGETWSLFLKCPNLKRLEVADFAELTGEFSINTNLTSFKLVEHPSYATYGYSEPSDSITLLSVLFKYCPKLHSIDMEPQVYYLEFKDLYNIVKEHRDLTLLHISATFTENPKVNISRVKDMDCSFLEIHCPNPEYASAMTYLFPGCHTSLPSDDEDDEITGDEEKTQIVSFFTNAMKDAEEKKAIEEYILDGYHSSGSDLSSDEDEMVIH